MINIINTVKTIKTLNVTANNIMFDKQLLQQMKPKIFPLINKRNKLNELIHEIINELYALIELAKKFLVELSDQPEFLHYIEQTVNLLDLIDITNETIVELTKC